MDDAKLPIQFGRFQLNRLLGSGGMGSVYEAFDSESQSIVAIKIPDLNKKSESQILKRFFREAASAAEAKHPNVCEILDFGAVDDMPFLSMAYLQGVTLGDWLEEIGIPDQKTALEITSKLASGLAAAHAQKLVHRDLKPANIMMVENEPIILDFGMVRRLGIEESILTPEGAVVGTPAYMAPEQIMGERAAIGPWTDLYSLGVILYEMLTGSQPFTGSIATIMGTIVSDPPPALDVFQEGLDPRLNSICQKALGKMTSDRFQDGESFRQAIQAYLDGNDPIPNEKATTQKGLLGGLGSIFRRKR